MTLSSTEINEIVVGLQNTDWDEAVVTVGDVTIALARNGATLSKGPSAPMPLSAATPVASDITPNVSVPQHDPKIESAPPAATVGSAEGRQAGDIVISANSVGIFWSAPEPGAPAFVEIGSKVQQQDVVCIVEIMKLMNHIVTETEGVITEVLAENGQSVEVGTPLFVVRPQGV